MGFIIAKLFEVFLSPGNGLALLLVAGAFLAVSHDETRRCWGRRISFAGALLLFLIGIFPVGEWMLVPLENCYPTQRPDHVAGIIVLSGDEKAKADDSISRPVLLDSARRYIAFAALARQYPSATLLYTGGAPQASVGPVKQADVARQVLSSLGVATDKMLVEDAARNTHENAIFGYKVAHPQADQTWLLVTSAYHMPRAMLSFQKAGWNVAPATTGYLTDGRFSTRLQFNLGQHLMEMSWAMHEYYGLIAYRLMGYTDHLWPQ